MYSRIAILASGNGTNAISIIKKSRQGALQAEIPVIICNEPTAGIIARAREAGVTCVIADHRDFDSREQHDLEMIRLVRQANCDVIALAGYLRLLSPAFFREFQGPVLNIHPSLLPAFPGLHGIGDAFQYGVRLTGPTVHFVDEKMDNGPIIIQASTVIKDADSMESLEERIHMLEHRIYPQALQWVIAGRLSFRNRRVELRGQKNTVYAAAPENCLIWPPLEEGF